jgi:putative ABC transport system ATP-binding protein
VAVWAAIRYRRAQALALLLLSALITACAVFAPSRSPARHRPADVADRVDAALGDVGLAESGDHLVEELSGGQQQRVAVARGLAVASPVLLADEPTSELDHANRAKVLELLRARADRGAVVVMATHDPEAAAVCDGEVQLDEGRLSRRR